MAITLPINLPITTHEAKAMIPSQTRSSVSKSLTPTRGTLLRWASALAGIIAAFLIPFDDAKTARGFIALIICALTAVSQYVARRNDNEHKAELAALRSTMEAAQHRHDAAERSIESLELGRRLSPPQMGAIAASLSGIDLSGIHVSISFVAAATGAQDFAESLGQFLTNRLGIRCEGPVARNPQATPQPQPRINDTLFIVQSNPSVLVERLAEAFSAAVLEIHRSGEGSFGNVTLNNQIMIVVGHSTQ